MCIYSTVLGTLSNMTKVNYGFNDVNSSSADSN